MSRKEVNAVSGRSGLWRSRWAAVGAAVAVTLGAGGLTMANAETAQSVFVPISTQRVLDTRSGVGLSGRFVSTQPRRLDVTGTIPVVLPGGSTGSAPLVPDGATAVVLNVTAVDPTHVGFVAVRPGTASGMPTTSNINITSPGGVYPNAVTVQVPTTGDRAGTIELYYFGQSASARTDLLVDLVGYYVPGSGAQGPKGDPGPKGDRGPQGDVGPQGGSGARGQRGPSAWETIPSGATVTGEFGWDSHTPTGAINTDEFYVAFGARAPSQPTVYFTSGSGFGGANAACSGTWDAPITASGVVCVYPYEYAGINVAATTAGPGFTTHGFFISVMPANSAGTDMYIYGTWAYRAP